MIRNQKIMICVLVRARGITSSLHDTLVVSWISFRFVSTNVSVGRQHSIFMADIAILGSASVNDNVVVIDRLAYLRQHPTGTLTSL